MHRSNVMRQSLVSWFGFRRRKGFLAAEFRRTGCVCSQRWLWRPVLVIEVALPGHLWAHQLDSSTRIGFRSVSAPSGIAG